MLVEKFIPYATYLDYEFNRVTHPNVNPVCCTTHRVTPTSVETIDWWLHNDLKAQAELAEYIKSGHEKEVLVGYAAVAEGRATSAIGLDPVKLKWIDQFFEWRMLTNHNDNLLYGNQLVNGQVKFTKKPPPKWERTEEDNASSFKPKHSLAECTYKLTGLIRDTEHKNLMRDLIISDPDSFTPEEAKAIMAYCREDTIFLPTIMERMLEEYAYLGIILEEQFLEEMLLRGKYAALTAKMEDRGYPINYEKTRNFSASIAPILEEAQREINSLFPEIRPFKYDRLKRKFTWDQKRTKEWLKDNVDTKKWMKTDGLKKARKAAIAKATEVKGKKLNPVEREEAYRSVDVTEYLSLALEAWTNVFDFKHSYPKSSFGAQMVRYLKLKQNLAGFTESAKTGSFWDAVGPDKRVRPYFNPFGSLTGRSQPGSKSFLFLKPAWMRALCEPNKGRAIGSVDYGSEEYLITALVSECDEMVDAYDSGDVYLAFAKDSGQVPENATKESHPEERQLAKGTVLALSYLQTAKGLAAKLTSDTGKVCTEEQAEEYIRNFYEVYSALKEWQDNIQIQYANDGYLELPCGWTLWGDNDNFRSVTNCPSQGRGGSILRKAVEFCEEKGLEVILTLHDAIYIEFDHGDHEKMDILMDCMKRAFMFYFPDQQEDAAKIRMDPMIWGPDYPAPKVEKVIGKDGREKEKKTYHSIVTPLGNEIDVTDIYIDDRSESEYKQFSKYFNKREEDYL